MADNSIVVKNPYDALPQVEGDAAAILTAGEILEVNASGNLAPHSTATGPWGKLVCGLSLDPDDAKEDDIASGERVRALLARPGMEMDLLLATGNNASVGSLLASDGNGHLEVYTGQDVNEGETATYTVYEDSVIVGEAKEALNNTTGSPARLEVRLY